MSAPRLPASVRQLRRFTVAGAQARGFQGDCDTLALLVSEVATNALLHGDGEVRLQLTASPGRVRVEVSDASDRVPTERPAGLDAESGRGMTLLRELSDSWGVLAHPPHGKTVWFEMAR